MSPLALTATYDSNSPQLQGLIKAFIFLNLVPNTIILPLLVGTFLFSRTATRHPILVNVCIAWVLSGIYSCLLFYAGQHVGPEPRRALCIAQWSLLAGITPMWSVAILMLVCHMAMMFNTDYFKAKYATIRLSYMLAAPYVAHFGFSLAAFILSVELPDDLSRNRRIFYCSLKYNPFTNAMSVFTFIVCIAITAVEVHLAVMLYRNWRGIRMAGRSGPINLQILLRVLAFGIYIFFGMIVTIITIFQMNSRFPDIFAATVGAALVLVFGTQADVFRAWCFWRRAPEPVLPQEPDRKSFRFDLLSDAQTDLEFLNEKKRWDIRKPPTAKRNNRS